MALDQGTPLSEPLCGDFLQGHSLDVGEETPSPSSLKVIR